MINLMEVQAWLVQKYPITNQLVCNTAVKSEKMAALSEIFCANYVKIQT